MGIKGVPPPPSGQLQAPPQKSETMAIDVATRGRIIGMKEAGIASQQVAEITGIAKRTIDRIYKQFQEKGVIKHSTSPGRPTKLSDRDRRSLIRVVNAAPRMPLSEITNAAGLGVREQTVRRELRKAGIYSRVAARKPHLTLAHRARRVRFARAHVHWTIEDWKKVIWTDESTFEIGKISRRIVVWRRNKERYASQNLVPTFKSGRTSMMVWGAFIGSRLSTLVTMPKNLRKAVDFVEVVYKGELERFWAEVLASGVEGMILMEDGAPIHRSNAPKAWREAHGIPKMEWPAQSPDLNPIEMLWKILKDAVQHKRNRRPKNVAEMELALKEEWGKVTGAYLERLIESMPARMRAVIKAKGGSTRW